MKALDETERIERIERTGRRWTHIALANLSADIRDGYLTGDPNVETGGAAVNWDTVYVPDQNGTPFVVIFVERVGYGTGSDYKRVYAEGDAGVADI